MADPYEPPAGNLIPLAFEGAYTPPAGDRVPLEFARGEAPPGEAQFLFPTAWSSLGAGAPDLRNSRAFVGPAGFAAYGSGTATVWKWHTFVTPSGFNGSAVGALVAQLKHRPIAPGGINSMAGGNPTIINRNRYVAGGNIAAPAWGNPSVRLYTRFLVPTGLLASAFATTARVSHDRQFAQLLSGITAPPIGTAWVSYGTRLVQPNGYFLDGVARPNVGGTRFVSPPGWDSTAFGTRIIPESQTLAPLGFREEWGATEIKNHLGYVLPPGFETNIQEQFRWGRAEVWNLRQVVQQDFDPDSELNPPPWPQWTQVENRNRIVGTFGAPAALAGIPQIDNNARLIQPAGAVPPGFPGTAPAGMVAFGVRRLPLEGIEAPPLLSWNALYNAARVIAPAGVDMQAFGEASAENTRRYYQRIGDIDSAAIGEAFIDFAIRTLNIEPRYTIAPPDVPVAEVKLYTRYLEPRTEDMARLGLAALSVHFNIITPRWTQQQDLFGEAALFNVTPEMRGFGWNAEEFGNAFVRLQWRPVAPDGNITQLFGLTKIADRKQAIVVPGNNFMRIGDKLVVTKTGAPPYSPQWIIQDRAVVDSASVFGRPGFNQYVLYTSGVPVPGVGSPSVRSNTIAIDAGIKVDEYGVPFVGLQNRGITVGPWADNLVFDPPAVRVTPHTIWAVVEAPAQAIRNHGASNLHYVGQTQQYAPGARFGQHRVSTYLGRLAPSSIGNVPPLGQASIFLHRRYIEPSGLQAYRMGWVTVGDGTQFVAQFGGADMQVFGRPAVARGPYFGPQTVRPAGLLATSFSPTNWVSLLHRTFQMPGFSALGMGSSRGEGPYQWQSLHVGPPMPTIPAGFDAQRFGTQWISLRVRGLEPPGLYTFASEYDPEHFAERMHVRNAYVPPGPPARAMSPVGVDLLGMGMPNVWPAVHFIRPDGNADQYRKGAF